MDEQQERDTATDLEQAQHDDDDDEAQAPAAPPPPERSDFEALASRVLALAQHGEHYTLDLIDAAVHRVHPEDVEAKAKRIAARILSLVGSGEWWHHENVQAAITVAEAQAKQ